ncbi:Holliday junction resolvase RuvX [Maridesulfovibrio hydrothermalis]|uniref:Putative pre-16S rRNA nuclease n=1 Tax=Maridesulfovibrio hydrothermalis AM13 = DSM 14728 TaxID=1121451 RepID=L0REW2_9BACT|nr:Holliday junction resolvase RuvX [Maridesulfovibrio hydrothermalis]CCO25323.1 putative Holliday junction resolvase [Maridesulfovibrio hydrothermalis AM13 = DSM 14728]
MKALGIDFGTKRVGLAMTDPGGILAFPFKVIQRTTRNAMFTELLEIIEKEKVDEIIIGLPLSLDGEDTLTTRQVRNFAASMERRVDLPIHLVDERLSSVAAEEELKEAGLWDRKRKKNLDSQAAKIILETWLNRA